MNQGTHLHISTHPLFKGLGDRQTSLLPGQVRTPNLPAYSPITDWAATSTVWDEEEETGTRGKVAVSREDSQCPPSITTPLQMYQKGEVWSSEGGLNRGASCSFVDVPQQLSNTAAKAGNASNSTFLLPAATTKKGAGVRLTPANTTSENKTSAVSEASLMTSGGTLNRQERVEEGERMVVREGAVVEGAAPASSLNPSPPPAESTYTASRIKYCPTPSRLVSSLEDVAASVIAAAGLPMSIVSLVDYIMKGQLQLPQPFEGGNEGGMNHSCTQIHLPPHGCSWEHPSQFNGGVSFVADGQRQLPPSMIPPRAVQQSALFASIAPSVRAVPNVVPAKRKSQSESLSDLLYFHANFFPPPPPPRVPKQTRRSRAELWYHFASKWDITHRLPPPPRTPLPEMELEQRENLLRLSRTPYHGDTWLKVCERWFEVTKQQFDYPPANTAVPIPRIFVLSQVVAS
ncbi:hypothetical protein ECC02_010723 [Trypanosoma cruzi]|uniref:Uncharacterized protein n=1 Tax=Trypanosoma cruzi TaxID=5693 RepID=A0A7J6XRP5_TRYCR|nr:hypothetical protein ECC02_010723 [Trypanosoma cruzi]